MFGVILLLAYSCSHGTLKNIYHWEQIYEPFTCSHILTYIYQAFIFLTKLNAFEWAWHPLIMLECKWRPLSKYWMHLNAIECVWMLLSVHEHIWVSLSSTECSLPLISTCNWVLNAVERVWMWLNALECMWTPLSKYRM